MVNSVRHCNFSGTVQFVSVTMLGTGSCRFLVTLFDQVSWVLGSFLGGLIGSVISFDSTGIDFAMIVLFTTVFIQQWIDSKCHIPAILGFLNCTCPDIRKRKEGS